MPTINNSNAQTKQELIEVVRPTFGIAAEWDSLGNIVYKYQGIQSVIYNSNGTVESISATVSGTVYTQTITYDVNGKVSQITATNGANTWINTITYNANGTYLQDTGWVKQ